MPKTTAVALKAREDSVGKLMMGDDFKKQLQRALPQSGVTAERMARVAFTEVRRNPKLMDCTQVSLMQAVMDCATYGLEPGPMGLAWIIPYAGEASFQLGYKGLVALMWRSGQITSISAEVVREGDVFDWDEGSAPFVTFRRSLHVDRSECERIAVFATIATKTGGTLIRVMSAKAVDEHREKFSQASRRAREKGGKDSPWETDWDEMACKTLLKMAAKRAPVTADVLSAIALDDRAEHGPPTPPIDVTAKVETIEAEVLPAEKPKPKRAKGEGAPITSGQCGILRAKAAKRATALGIKDGGPTILGMVLEAGGVEKEAEVTTDCFDEVVEEVESYEMPPPAEE